MKLKVARRIASSHGSRAKLSRHPRIAQQISPIMSPVFQISKDLYSRFFLFWKRPFLRNVLTVAGGAAMAQGINFAFAPVLTRIYGPAAFGALSVFTAAITLLAPIVALTYPTAIVLPKTQGEAAAIAKLSMWIGMAMASVLLGFTLVLPPKFALSIGIGDVQHVTWLVPVALAFVARNQIATQWLIRFKCFRAISAVTVIKAVVLNTAIITAGMWSNGAAMLVAISAGGYMVHAIMLDAGVRWMHPAQRSDVPVRLKDALRKYADFPFYQAPHGFIIAVSTGLPVVLMASFFGAAIAGMFGLGVKVLGLPAALIGNAVGQVFYPKIAESANRGEKLAPPLFAATGVLALVGIPVFGVISIISPKLFPFLFGDEWVVAGEYGRWLALWLFFSFLNQPSAKAIIVMKRQKIAVVLDLTTMVLRIMALWIGARTFESPLLAVVGYSLVSAAHNILFVALACGFALKYDKQKYT